MGKLDILQTEISGVYLVDAHPFIDHRGEWGRLFCQEELKSILGERQLVNINLSKTTARGTVRGMHYQLPPMAEMKLVRCLHGTIFDVAVDLRPNSATYLKWIGVELSEENRKMIVIPEGFAHGFQALTDDVEMLYLHTQFYSPELERGLRYNDEELGINWPIPPIGLSDRDSKHPLIDSTFEGVILDGERR